MSNAESHAAMFGGTHTHPSSLTSRGHVPFRTSIAFLAAAALVLLPGLAPAQVSCADEAVPDEFSTLGGLGPAFILNGIADDLVFDMPGQFIQYPDGTALLTGRVTRLSDPDTAFVVHVTFSGEVDPSDPAHPPIGSPKEELDDSAYADHGGPIDPSTWVYYPVFQGTLTGIGAAAGAELFVTRSGPSFQVGAGASGRNLELGGAAWLDVTTVSQPDSGPAFPADTDGDMNFNFANDCIFWAAGAELDASGAVPGGHAFILPGIGNDFVFSAAGEFIEKGDGTARLFGIIERLGAPDHSFVVEIAFANRVDASDPSFPPVGSPKKELAPAAYSENGGPVDPSTWHYYETFTGTLTGKDAFEGALLTLDRFGPSFQVGFGASGKNLGYGASGWINVKTVQQPTGGLTLPMETVGDGNFAFSAECDLCVDAADPSVLATVPSVHAVSLPGIATDFVTMLPGTFTEFPDGTARLVMQIERLSAPTERFILDVAFTDLATTDDPSYPPPGSPKKELVPGAYAENGGPVDPSTWRYYQEYEGLLIGMGAYEGAVLSVSRMGPAFQVGFGANGKNLVFGASGWFDAALLGASPPGFTFPSDVDGDMNFDFADECIEEGLPATYGTGCPGAGGFVPSFTVHGIPKAGTELLMLVAGANGGQPALLLIGTDRAAEPAPGGCTLLVQPNVGVLGPFILDGFGPGLGALSATTIVPPVLQSSLFTGQVFVLDAGAPDGIAATNGVEAVLHN